MQLLAPLAARRAIRLGLIGTTLAAGLVMAAADAPTSHTLTEDNVIAGTMDIDFGTRTNLDTSGDLKDGSAAVGARTFCEDRQEWSDRQAPARSWKAG